MDSRKIYSYYSLTPLDIIDSIEWAREKFAFYDGVTSPLWNQHVQHEFARLNKERDSASPVCPDFLDLIEETN